jgi:hypothetical protein
VVGCGARLAERKMRVSDIVAPGFDLDTVKQIKRLRHLAE